MVSFNSILIASAFSLASADIAASIDAVASNASSLSARVVKWNSQQGLSPALDIQNGYYPLSSAVSSLNKAVDGVSQQQISSNVDRAITLTSNVSGLLDALSAKAADFQSVGAYSIVTSDINGLSTPAAQIVSKLLASNNDAAVRASLESPIDQLADAFSTAISAYKASSVDFPRVN